MFFSSPIRRDNQDSPLAAHSQSLATDLYNVLLPLVDNEIFVIVLDLYAGFCILWIVFNNHYNLQSVHFELISLSNTGFSLKAGNQLKDQLLWGLRHELSTFGEKLVKWGSKSFKLPTAPDCQAAYFYILPVYLKRNENPGNTSVLISVLISAVNRHLDIVQTWIKSSLQNKLNCADSNFRCQDGMPTALLSWQPLIRPDKKGIQNVIKHW